METLGLVRALRSTVAGLRSRYMHYCRVRCLQDRGRSVLLAVSRTSCYAIVTVDPADVPACDGTTTMFIWVWVAQEAQVGGRWERCRLPTAPPQAGVAEKPTNDQRHGRRVGLVSSTFVCPFPSGVAVQPRRSPFVDRPASA